MLWSSIVGGDGRVDGGGDVAGGVAWGVAWMAGAGAGGGGGGGGGVVVVVYVGRAKVQLVDAPKPGEMVPFGHSCERVHAMTSISTEKMPLHGPDTRYYRYMDLTLDTAVTWT